MTLRHRAGRPHRKRPVGAALVLGSVLALLAQPGLSPSAGAVSASSGSRASGPKASDWQSYVETPAKADVCPTAVVRTSGTVAGARNLLCGGSGGTTLTTAEGGAAASIVLDYGKEVGGLPYFTVSARTGTPSFTASYSEGLNYVGPSGDGSAPWGDGDSARSDSYQVSSTGTITNRFVQGGERYEQITLTTPGSLTLGKAGIHYIADRTQAKDYGGYFVSSSDQLNKIWYAGAYTLQTDLAPAHSLPGNWTVADGALDVGGSKLNDGAGTLNSGTSWGDYTSTFQARIQLNQAGWLVRAQGAQDGYLFILNDSSDSTGAPNTLQEFDLHAGAYTSLGSVPLPAAVAADSWHTVATSVSGSSLTVSLDGTRVATVDTSAMPSDAVAYPAGTVGFREFAGEEASFKDLTVVGSDGRTLFKDGLDRAASLAKFTPAGSNALPSVLDGARRDRAIWSGDINTEGLTDYYSVDNPEYIKQSLDLLGSRQLSSGFVPGALAPAAVPHLGPLTPGSTTTYSASYSMYFVTALAGYYLYTGDHAFLAQEWPAVQRELAWNATQLDANGLFATKGGVDGADWDFYDSDKGGEVSAYNILYYKALVDGASLAAAAGDASAAATYTADAQALKTRINDRLYNPATGLYRISDTQPTGTAQDANALAVLWGVAPASQDAAILAKLKTELWTTPYGPLPYSRDAGYSELISPFVSGFELQARLATGDTADAEALLDTEWGHMIAPGPDQTGTLWENISSTDGTPGLGAGASLSHGWSTAPTSALSGYVLGVQPATAGFATWTVQPHPGDLAWSQGRVPTPHGDIDVRWTAQQPGHGFSLTVTAPRSTSGTIAVPVSGGNPVVTVNGRTVWRHGAFTPAAGVTAAHAGSGYLYLTVGRQGGFTVVST
ncbi:alpha-L-rhamnosidase C-terminal domain-containing protein [Streptacidiphilus sp. N1-12]|uniref:Alpha-L-rhamnosidase C-terminal domain-containing protein n=2 Tax=Streptacidiphilus alkalitolerans TaxID=3342712 RepID=A0ABV6V5G9_9ACTN